MNNKQDLKEDLAGFYASRRLLSFGNMISEKEDENIHKRMLAFMKKHEIEISGQELSSAILKKPPEFLELSVEEWKLIKHLLRNHPYNSSGGSAEEKLCKQILKKLKDEPGRINK